MGACRRWIVPVELRHKQKRIVGDELVLPIGCYMTTEDKNFRALSDDGIFLDDDSLDEILNPTKTGIPSKDVNALPEHFSSDSCTGIEVGRSPSCSSSFSSQEQTLPSEHQPKRCSPYSSPKALSHGGSKFHSPKGQSNGNAQEASLGSPNLGQRVAPGFVMSLRRSASVHQRLYEDYQQVLRKKAEARAEILRQEEERDKAVMQEFFQPKQVPAEQVAAMTQRLLYEALEQKQARLQALAKAREQALAAETPFTPCLVARTSPSPSSPSEGSLCSRLQQDVESRKHRQVHRLASYLQQERLELSKWSVHRFARPGSVTSATQRLYEDAVDRARRNKRRQAAKEIAELKEIQEVSLHKCPSTSVAKAVWARLYEDHLRRQVVAQNVTTASPISEALPSPGQLFFNPTQRSPRYSYLESLHQDAQRRQAKLIQRRADERERELQELALYSVNQRRHQKRQMARVRSFSSRSSHREVSLQQESEMRSDCSLTPRSDASSLPEAPDSDSDESDDGLEAPATESRRSSSAPVPRLSKLDIRSSAETDHADIVTSPTSSLSRAMSSARSLLSKISNSTRFQTALKRGISSRDRLANANDPLNTPASSPTTLKQSGKQAAPTPEAFVLSTHTDSNVVQLTPHPSKKASEQRLSIRSQQEVTSPSGARRASSVPGIMSRQLSEGNVSKSALRSVAFDSSPSKELPSTAVTSQSSKLFDSLSDPGQSSLRKYKKVSILTELARTSCTAEQINEHLGASVDSRVGRSLTRNSRPSLLESRHVDSLGSQRPSVQSNALSEALAFRRRSSSTPGSALKNETRLH